MGAQKSNLLRLNFNQNQVNPSCRMDSTNSRSQKTTWLMASSCAAKRSPQISEVWRRPVLVKEPTDPNTQQFFKEQSKNRWVESNHLFPAQGVRYQTLNICKSAHHWGHTSTRLMHQRTQQKECFQTSLQI